MVETMTTLATIERTSRREPMPRTSPRPASKRRLIIVANRLPVHQAPSSGKRPRWQRSPGGLVSALGPFVEKTEGSWVGWPGTNDGPESAGVKPFRHEGIDNQPVMLSQDDLDGFYFGFSNATLWPLYHDAIRTPVFRRRWWRTYVEVNRRYAQATAKAIDPGDVVWVHDYQLQLVPAMLRELVKDVRIGFFLHIPFPPEEIFARLPWRTEVIEGLLGADLIGFQTKLGSQNFIRAARRFTSAKGAERGLLVNGRSVGVGAFPISIDVARYEELARSETVKARAEELRESFGRERTIILGVDRADYTKGIDVRLRAFREMLRRGRRTVRDCVLSQVAVPTRSEVEEYERLRRTVEELVGRINGEHGEPGLAAVHYLRRNLPIEELVAFYLAADVMAVTPLRDGMNLVAKEYVAARLDNAGVLVLSEFTGAAHELRASLLVNPYDVDGMASTLESATQLSGDDVRRRMTALRRALKRNDVFNWAEGFIRQLTGR
jgi:trehalose 6-phosphate synthase